jgi:heme/copper-type cytochrome/quinol oxidase subunit 2
MRNGRILGYDYKLAVIATVSTFVLILEHYHHIGPQFPEITPLVFYVIFPLSISYLIFREKPADFGIRTGNWRLGLISIVICLSIMAVVIYSVAGLQSFEDYYRLPKDTNWGKLIVDAAFYMFSWEFIFRGYMLFGL